MVDSKTRKRCLRARRQQAGLKATLVWLSPEAQAAMVALRQPGETVDVFFNRALITLQALAQAGTSHVPRHSAMPAEARPSDETYRATILQRIHALRAQQPPRSWQQIAEAFNREGLGPNGLGGCAIRRARC